jgi:NADH:ubiquinone oxidoreductase subunit 6 (subunit J)
MAAVFFFIAAIGALAGAIGVIVVRNPFYSVLSLVGHLLCLAGLFLLLRAEFVAASQVIVYAGAVMVLYVFVVSYVGGDVVEVTGSGGRTGRVGGGARLGALVFCGALAIELFIAVLGTGIDGIHHYGARFVPGFGSPQQIGRLLLTKFLFVFEASSFLLLIAAVGAVVLARRRRGIDGEEEGRISVMDLLRPRGTGTMAEGVGQVQLLPEDAEHEERQAAQLAAAAATRRGTEE